jgi:hypothetical protein
MHHVIRKAEIVLAGATVLANPIVLRRPWR